MAIYCSSGPVYGALRGSSCERTGVRLRTPAFHSLVEAALVAEVRQILSRPEEMVAKPASCALPWRPATTGCTCRCACSAAHTVQRSEGTTSLGKCGGARFAVPCHNWCVAKCARGASRAGMQQCEPQGPRAAAGPVLQATTQRCLLCKRVHSRATPPSWHLPIDRIARLQPVDHHAPPDNLILSTGDGRTTGHHSFQAKGL